MAKKQQPQGGSNKKAPKKQKQPAQKTPMQRVMILGANQKIRFEWRPW